MNKKNCENFETCWTVKIFPSKQRSIDSRSDDSSKKQSFDGPSTLRRRLVIYSFAFYKF